VFTSNNDEMKLHLKKKKKEEGKYENIHTVSDFWSGREIAASF
jgi:hypothetical protein